MMSSVTSKHERVCVQCGKEKDHVNDLFGAFLAYSCRHLALHMAGKAPPKHAQDELLSSPEAYLETSVVDVCGNSLFRYFLASDWSR
jgi:hypothetical protein